MRLSVVFTASLLWMLGRGTPLLDYCVRYVIWGGTVLYRYTGVRTPGCTVAAPCQCRVASMRMLARVYLWKTPASRSEVTASLVGLNHRGL